MTTKQAKKIKILLIEKDLTGGQIAKKLGVTRGAVWHVITGRRKSPWIRKAISEVLEIPYEKLWEEE